MTWVKHVLIPDLKESGTVETAKDFEKLVKMVKKYSRSSDD